MLGRIGQDQRRKAMKTYTNHHVDEDDRFTMVDYPHSESGHYIIIGGGDISIFFNDCDITVLNSLIEAATKGRDALRKEKIAVST